MIYNVKNVFAFVLVVLCVIVTSQISQAKILFEEDFEGGKLDEKKWHPKAEWNIMKPDEPLALLGKGIMDTAAGQANTTKDDTFKPILMKKIGKESGPFIMEFDHKGMNR